MEWTTGRTTGMDHWNGLLEWTPEHAVQQLHTKTYKYNEAALNQKHSVAHVITYLKFKTYMDG